MKPFGILIVEDNRDLVELVVKYLDLCGWHATAAASETEVWKQLGRNKPSLILLDISIPGMETFALVSTLKKEPRYADIPIIAVTGMSSARDKNRCIAAGFDKVLAKPFHLDELRRRIECFVNKNNNKIRGGFMRTTSKHFAAVALLTLALTGCQAMTGRTAGRNVDDARISTAVQATLTSDKASNFTRIDVDTTNGIVYLNGTVQDAKQKARAEQLAGRIDGVKKVVNNLQVGS